MSFRHSSGVWGVVAVVAFALPGIGVLVATFLGVFGGGQAGASFAMFGLGLVMIVVGGAAAFWRIDVVIDREQRTVTERRWLMGFVRREVYAWDSIAHVEIYRRRVQRTDRFEVRLDAADGRVYLDEYATREAALATADKVAAFAELAVVDLAEESPSPTE